MTQPAQCAMVVNDAQYRALLARVETAEAERDQLKQERERLRLSEAELHDALLEINSDWSDWAEAAALAKVLKIAEAALKGRPDYYLTSAARAALEGGADGPTQLERIRAERDRLLEALRLAGPLLLSYERALDAELRKYGGETSHRERTREAIAAARAAQEASE